MAPTEAGRRLIEGLTPRFETIYEELAALEAVRDRPAATVRIAAADFATRSILLPRLVRLQRKFPDVWIDMTTDAGPTDIVTSGFDAVVRLGDQVSRDQEAVRISPDIRLSIVGAPVLVDRRGPPMSPSDLVGYACINLRWATGARVTAWDLVKGDRRVQVQVEGPWTFDCPGLALEAALAGSGLACLPEDLVRPHLRSARLRPVLRGWHSLLPGLHIVVARRRRASSTLALVVEALRHPALQRAHKPPVAATRCRPKASTRKSTSTRIRGDR